MSQPRPKPWETAAQTGASAQHTRLPSPSLNSTNPTTTTTSTSTNTGSTPPVVPPIPSSLQGMTNTSTSTSTSGIGSYGGNTYGNSYGSGYGNTYGNTYGSSYGGMGMGMGMNRYGGGLSGMGMNSYGMGGYGMGYGGMGSYGMNGMNGMNGVGGMNGMGGVADATTRTFQVLENVVYAVSACAALLESTYYATHNSFFTILGVADQLNSLGGGVTGAIRDTIKGVGCGIKQITAPTTGSGAPGGRLGLYAVLAWLKRILRKLLGLSNRGDKDSIAAISGSHALLQEFSNWRNGANTLSSSSGKKTGGKGKGKGMSLKPLLVFLVALIGLPVVMSKFVRYIEQQNHIQQGQQQGQQQQPQHIGQPAPGKSIDPKSLAFARAIYDYIPEREDEQANGWKELKLGRGDLVALLDSTDGWSHCRTRDGRIGYAPTSYLEIVKRGGASKQQTISDKKTSDVVNEKAGTNEGTV